MQIIAQFKLKSGTVYQRAYHKGNSFTIVKVPHVSGVHARFLYNEDEYYFMVLRQFGSQEYGYQPPSCRLP